MIKRLTGSLTAIGALMVRNGNGSYKGVFSKSIFGSELFYRKRMVRKVDGLVQPGPA